VERRVEVRTGEAVAFAYELAGLGSRFLAVFVDMFAQTVTMIALVILIGVTTPGFMRWVSPKAYTSASVAILAAASFLITTGWFVLFEMYWGGRTPGKRLLGIRTVRDGGFPLDPGASIIRNVVRNVEFALGFYAVSAVVALLSSENKRLGDLAAGTIVVRERTRAPIDLDAYLATPARSDTGLRDDDRVLIERFLARRRELDPAARARLAHQIAARIRPTLRASYNNLDDESLLDFLAGR